MKTSNTAKKKVLIALINYGYLKGGGEYYAHQIGSRLEAAGDTVEYVCGRDSFLMPSVLGNPGSVHYVFFSYLSRRFGERGKSKLHLLARSVSYFLYLWSATRFFRKNMTQYDVVNCQDIFSTMAALRASKKTRVVSTLHGMPVKWEMNYLRQVDHLIAVNKEIAEFVRQEGAQNVSVIEPGADEELFQPGDKVTARQKIGIDPDLTILLFVGRLIPVKNIESLIAALPALIKDLPKLQFHLVGMGVLESDLKRMAEELGVSEKVRFWSHVAHDQLPDYYQAADLLVVSSWVESFSMVALEALFTGCPVVTSDKAEIAAIFPEIIPTFPPDSIEEIEKCLVKNLQEAEAGRQKVEKFRPQLLRYSWKSRLALTNEVFFNDHS